MTNITQYYSERLAFGKRMRELRKKRNLTQSGLAELLGFNHPATICNIEKGRRLVYVDELPELMRALNCSSEEILGTIAVRSSCYPSTRSRR